MKRFVKSVLPLLPVLIACSIIFTACFEGPTEGTEPSSNGSENQQTSEVCRFCLWTGWIVYPHP